MNWRERAKTNLIETRTSHGMLVRVYPDRIAVQSESADAISWELLQKIKTDVLGDIVAIEIYPIESDVVNLRNTRHLWYGYPVSVKPHPEFTS